MAELDQQDINALLKEVWPSELQDDAVVKDHPFLGLITRDKKPIVGEVGGKVGKAIMLPVQHGKTPSRSRKFGTAQANMAPSSYETFQLTIRNDYAVGGLTGMAMDLAKQGNVATLIDEAQREMWGALETLGDQMGMDVFRNHGGSRGQFLSVTGAPPAEAEYELVDPSDIYFIERHMVLRAASTDGTSGSLRSGSLTVTRVDENAGTFHATGEIVGLTANDHLFADGDFGLAPAGITEWVPETVSTSDSHYGVNRSENRARLAGVFIDADANGWNYEQAFIQAKAREKRGYAKAKYYVAHPDDIARIETLVNGKRRVVNDNEYSIGFEAIDAYGKTIYSDPNAIPGVAFGVAEGAFGFYSLGECPSMVDDDSLTMMRVPTASSPDDTDYRYQFWAKGRYNFGSKMPYGLNRIKFATGG